MPEGTCCIKALYATRLQLTYLPTGFRLPGDHDRPERRCAALSFAKSYTPEHEDSSIPINLFFRSIWQKHLIIQTY